MSVFATLDKSSSLTKLVLDKNDIKGFNTKAILSFCRGQRKLVTLSMRQCNLGPEICINLFSGLSKFNRSIKTVNLEKNHIGDVGFQTIIDIFKINEHPEQLVLEDLELAENDITDESGIPFAQFLDTNETFKKIGLRKNDLTTETGRIFEKSLR